LEEQQPLISKHIDTLIKQLSVSEGPQNMCDWFNFVSFDIIGDLALGQSLGCLENGKYHPLARHLIGAFKAGILMSSLNRYIPLSRLKFALRCAIPKRTIQQNKSFLVNLSEQVSKRLESTTTRPDFISYMLKDDKNDLTMTKMDIQANVAVFFIGGSESGASLLAGTLFYLLKDSARMAKAVHEIRSTFANENDINFKTVSQLPYTLACLEEGLRVSTPTPFGIARRTTEPTVIADELVPANTSVSVPQWAAWHSAENFSRPNEFIPERWLDDKEFAGDSKNGFHPFSVGPRNCMGKK